MNTRTKKPGLQNADPVFRSEGTDMSNGLIGPEPCKGPGDGAERVRWTMKRDGGMPKTEHRDALQTSGETFFFRAAVV